MPYWNPYDLLGLFLSSLAPAPKGENAFYLPLAAVYARWCKHLGHQTPAVYSCIWRTGGANDEFFLGALLEGYDIDAKKTGTWEQHLRMAHFSLVDEEWLRLLGWSFARSPMIIAKGARGSRFGNCAETYVRGRGYSESRTLGRSTTRLRVSGE